LVKKKIDTDIQKRIRHHVEVGGKDFATLSD